MKDKKGFVFVETIITIVFLAAALLILYSSYRNAITEEKEKIYYDDISYLYRNYYLADFLINKTEIHNVKEEDFKNKYTIDLSEGYDGLFSEYQISQGYPEELKGVRERFNVNKMLIVSDDVIVECGSGENKACQDSYEGLSDGLTDYIKGMDIGTREINSKGEELKNYFLVVEYREKEEKGSLRYCTIDEEDCASFYVNLKLDINKPIENAELSIGKVCKGQRLAQCLKDNYKIENTKDEEGNISGIFHHDGDGEDSEAGEKEAKDDSYRYGGINVKNYVCFGEDECTGTKTDNLYRIIGVFGNNLKIIKDEGENKNWNSTETIIKTYSNAKYKNMIISKEWNIEGMNESILSSDALGVYNLEMSGSTKEANQGLMYVSEYMYGASPQYWGTKANNYNEAKEKNWLYKGIEWTVSKEKGTNNSYAINGIGNVGKNSVSTSSESRISMYLKDKVILVRGEGTKEDPYILSDTGIVISDLSGEEGYYDVTANVKAETDEGEIVEYYYSIYKDGKWSDWEKDTSDTHKFEGLAPDTEYPVKVKVLNNRGNYSEEAEQTFTTQYKAPDLSIVGSNSHGNIDDDTWTNEDITIEGNISGGIGESDVYYCRTSGTSCEPDTKASSMTDSSEGEETICFKTISSGARKAPGEIKCYKTKLDKQKPSCSLNITTSGVSFASTSDTGGSEVAQTGINKSTTASYDAQTTGLSAGTFYGHVLDNAGNHGSCSREIIATNKTYNKTTRTCNSYVSSYTCRKSASSYYYCPSGGTLNGTVCKTKCKCVSWRCYKSGILY